MSLAVFFTQERVGPRYKLQVQHAKKQEHKRRSGGEKVTQRGWSERCVFHTFMSSKRGSSDTTAGVAVVREVHFDEERGWRKWSSVMCEEGSYISDGLCVEHTHHHIT